MDRQSRLANAVGDRREIQAGRLQKLFDMRYDRFRRTVEELRALQRIVQIKVREGRAKRATLERQAQVLAVLRRQILGLTRSQRQLELLEQRARAISEVLRTQAANRAANFNFARSQLPQARRR